MEDNVEGHITMPTKLKDTLEKVMNSIKRAEWGIIEIIP